MLRNILKITLLAAISFNTFAGQNLDAIYTQVEELTKRVVDPKDKALLQARLAYRIMDSGMYDRARDLAYTIEEPITQSKMLQYIAITYALTFQKDKAIEVAEKTPLSNYSIPVYLKIAQIFHLIGLEDVVEPSLARAETEARALGIPSWESAYLAQTAQSYAYCGKLDYALDLTLNLTEAADKVETLAALAAFYENKKMEQEASEVMEIATKLAQKAWGVQKQADLLLKIAEGYESVAKIPENGEEILRNYKRKIYSELYDTDGLH